MAARKPLVYLNGRVGQLAAGDSITVDFSWLANKPTTLAGYGITDALNVNGVQTVVGVKTFTDDLFINTTAASGGLVISAPAGSLAEIWLRSGTLLRWSIRKSNEAEPGSDAGSNLDFNSYTDAGTIKSRVARWNRNTGILDFTNMPTVGGAALYSLATAPTYYSNTSGYDVNNLLPGQRVTVGASVTNAPVSAGITYWYIACESTYLADGASRVQRAVSWDGAVSALRTLNSGTWTAWAFVSVVSDSGWIDATLQNGWTNFGSPYSNAGYRKIGNEVFLRGLIQNGTTTNGTVIFQLGAGYRPANVERVRPATSIAGSERIDITTTGSTSISGVASGSNISLSGLSFLVD